VQNDYLSTRAGEYAAAEIKPPAYSTEIGIDFVFSDILRFFGSVKTYSKIAPDFSGFSPYRDEYTAGIEGRMDPVVVGVKHKCIHPIESFVGKDRKLFTEYRYGANETEIYVKISGRTRF